MKATLVLFTLCTLCLISPARAQRNFLPGYIVTRGSDTLRGLIDYRNWEKNPRKISFKSGGNDAEEQYGQDRIRLFEVLDHDIYVSAEVIRDMRPVEISPDINMDYSGIPAPENDTVFLRVLARGKKYSLYELIDFRPHYYLQKGNGPMEELQYGLVPDADKVHYNTFYTYRGQLRELAGPDRSIAQKTARARYTDKDLKQIVLLLNGDAAAQTADLPSKKNARFLAGAGLQYNNLSFPVDYQGINVLQTNSHSGCQVQVAVDLLTGRDLQKFFIRFQLAYALYNYRGYGERTENFYQQRKSYRYEVNMRSFIPSLLAAYDVYRGNKISLNLGVQTAFNISSYPKNNYTKTNMDTGESEEIRNLIDFEKSWLDFALRIGARISHVDLGISSRVAGSNVNYISWKSKYRTTALTIAYSLK